MGDRANIVVDDGYGSRVFLYTHWDGHELPKILQEALKRKARWNDPQYLARIVFQQMIGDDKTETGYGISSKIGDNSYPLLIVDCGDERVKLEGKRTSNGFSFAEYIELDEINWSTFK